MQQVDTQTMLYRARLQLEEGQNEAALQVLTAVHQEDEKTHRDVTYLLGWCYIQRKQWKEAIQALTPLLQQSGATAEIETPLERERMARYLLHLGVAAVNLAHYEDASRHFALCLKILHDKRIHLPAVRIKALYSLAMTCSMRGLYSVAIRHYTHALRLCRYYQRNEELADIHHGLCDAYGRSGEYDRAYSSGQEALRLYRNRPDWYMEARMQRYLGHICRLQENLREAIDHYTESLALATSFNNPTLVMTNCAELAELRLLEKRLDEAKRYSKLALTNLERSNNIHMRGYCYHVAGTVAYEEASQADRDQRDALLEQARSWFEKAKEELSETQAYVDIADNYSSLARVLEEIGHMDEAIEYWRIAYSILSQPEIEANRHFSSLAH